MVSNQVPYITYIPKHFRADAQSIIARADAICTEYAQQGFTLTLRQLYYQFVARGYIANKDTEYKRLGGIINDARLAGLINWDHLEDRTRELEQSSHWDGPSQIVEACAQQYRIDRWKDQPNCIEVWIEKDALTGVIDPVCRRNDVAYFSCRGYTSQSELWKAGRRLARYRQRGQEPIVLHLGDHDPSGIDMTRDITDRLDLFARGPVEVRRLALNMDQVRQYNPPPNPAKLTDSRVAGYIQRYGEESWELDALDPPTIDTLIQTNIDLIRDPDLWDSAIEQEDRHKEELNRASYNWTDIQSAFDSEDLEDLRPEKQEDEEQE